LVIQLATLVLSFVAFIALSLPPLEASLTFLGMVLAGVIIIIFLVRKDPQTEK
jgi:hypothetical protein